ERLEGPGGAFNNCALAFDEVEDVDGAARVVRHDSGEPVAARLDEFKRVQAGALLAPAVAGGNGLDLVDERAAHPVRRAVPLDIGRAMLQMNGARASVEAEAAPIPQLEGEDVGRGADFQNHAVAARAVDR